MRLSMALTSLLALFCAPQAQSSAITYKITFTGSGTTIGGQTIPSPTGSFTYDSTIPPSSDPMYAFSNFVVVWGTYGYFNFLNGSITGSPTCAGGQTGDAALFELLTNCPTGEWTGVIGDAISPLIISETDSNGTIQVSGNCECFDTPNQDIVDLGGGRYQSQQETPEPGTAALTLISLGWLLRKPIAHLCRQPARAHLFRNAL
jgi:hypothetical protein